jgi:hypothetical protein
MRKFMHRTTVTRIHELSFLLVIAFSATACSRTPANVAQVKGKVTLGGQPLPDATVMFTPTAATGSPSAGRTNAAGEYELVYTREVKGAEKGEHSVTISTYAAATDDPPAPETPEKVPFVYREGDKKLTATVNPGSNEINFDLEAGPVNPPAAKGKLKGKRLPCY